MRGKRTFLLAILTAILFHAPRDVRATAAEPLIIVSKRSKIERLSRSDLKQAYLGYTKVWPAGDTVVIVINTENETLMNSLTDYLGTTVAEFSKRWIRMSLSGAAPPPVEVESEAEMIEFVSKKPGAIGLLKSPSDKVRILEIE